MSEHQPIVQSDIEENTIFEQDDDSYTKSSCNRDKCLRKCTYFTMLLSGASMLFIGIVIIVKIILSFTNQETPYPIYDGSFDGTDPDYSDTDRSEMITASNRPVASLGGLFGPSDYELNRMDYMCATSNWGCCSYPPRVLKTNSAGSNCMSWPQYSRYLDKQKDKTAAKIAGGVWIIIIILCCIKS